MTSTPARNTTRSISPRLSTNCVEWTQIADPSRTWQARIADGLVAVGDEELLGRAVDNLLANVRAHTQKAWSPPSPRATTAMAMSSSRPATTVPAFPLTGSPASSIASTVREPRHTAPGSGLGLAIVTEIAATHEGSAEAALNHPHGLCVTLTLPACRQLSATQGS